jgi:hypothetical protein
MSESVIKGQAILGHIADSKGGNIKTACKALGINYNTGRRCVAMARAEAGETTPIPSEIDGGTEAEQTEADIEMMLEAILLNQAISADIDPVDTHLALTIPSRRPVAILLAGCMQTGGRWTHHKMLRDKFGQMLSHPGVYVGLFGDEIDNFRSGSFAGARSVYDQAIMPDKQKALWKLFMRQIGPRTLWGMWSQHGAMWDERDGHNVIKDTYREYKIPYFDGMGYVTLTVGSETYNLAVSHEFPGSSMYNKTHAQKRALWQRFPNADAVIQADRHQYAVSEETAYGHEVIAGNRKSPFVYLIQIGTAKGGPDQYTIRGWERGVMEWPWLVLYPDEHLIKVTRHFEDVQLWLEGYENTERPALTVIQGDRAA